MIFDFLDTSDVSLLILGYGIFGLRDNLICFFFQFGNLFDSSSLSNNTFKVSLRNQDIFFLDLVFDSCLEYLLTILHFIE